MASQAKKLIEYPPDPSEAHPICQKCTFFRGAVSPFWEGIWRDGDGKWQVGMPPPDATPQGGWICLIGDAIHETPDEEGMHMSDDLMQLTKIFEKFGLQGRLWYHPAMPCRPPLDPRGGIRKVQKAELTRCTKAFLAKRIEQLQPTAIIAAGPLATSFAVGRMDARRLEGRPHDYVLKEADGSSHLIPVHAIRDVETVMTDISQKPAFRAAARAIVEAITGRLVYEPPPDTTIENYVVGFDTDTVLDWFAPVLNDLEAPLYWDIESNGIAPHAAGYKIGIFSFYHKAQKQPLIVPTPDYNWAKVEYVRRGATEEQAERWAATWLEEIGPILQRVLKSEKLLKVGHNLQFDELSIFTAYKWEMGGFYADTMIWNYLIHPDEKAAGGLESVLARWAPEIPPYWVELEQWKGENPKHTYLDYPWHILVPYAAWDTISLAPVLERITDKLDELGEGGYGGFFVKLGGDTPFQDTYKPIQYAMFGRRVHQRMCTHLEKVGQHIDQALLGRIATHYIAERDEREKLLNTNETVQRFCAEKLGEVAGKSTEQYKAHKRGTVPSMNWGSNVQVKAFFIGYLGLKTDRKTSTGNVSVDEGTLAQFATQHPAADMLLRWRQSQKFISSFVTPILEKRVLWPDGRTHSHFKPSGTETSRLSASAPNVQAIPRDGLVKKLYCSRSPTGWMITRDYSGLEVRIIAAFAHDDVLIDIFNNGGDPHFNTQQHFFRDKANKSDKNQRAICKRALFGNIYGQGDPGLLEILSTDGVKHPDTGLPLSLEDCKNFNQMLFDAYPGIRTWVERAHAAAGQTAWSASAFGFVRPLEVLRGYSAYQDMEIGMSWEEKKAQTPEAKRFRRLRQLIAKDMRRSQNTPIQSTAGDITVFAAWEITRRLKRKGMEATAVNIVHDDIWVDTPTDDEVEEVTCTMHDVMDYSHEWLPELLPGYDPSWITIPIIGECDVGLNPKDAYKTKTEPTRRTPDKSMSGELTIKVGVDAGKAILKDRAVIIGEGKDAFVSVPWRGNSVGIREMLELQRNKIS